jgi:5-methylcytosine-specific restriction endonuclease McrA
MEMKKCKQCVRELPMNIDYFFKKKDTKDGLTNKCKECMGKQFTNKLTKIPKLGYKFCIKCDKELKSTASYFPVDKTCKDGLRNVCRKCGKEGLYMDDDYTPKHIWTDEENDKFKELYPNYTNKELIEIHYPKLTEKDLWDRAYRLGIVKSEETTERRYKLHSEKMYGVDSPLYGIKRSEETKQKLSLAKKGVKSYWLGKKRSLDQKLYLSKLKRESGQWKGENNPRHKDPLNGERNGNWQGGITSWNAKIRNSNEYLEWKVSVFKRDNYTCQCCGSKRNLEAHHIENFSSNPELRFDTNNGLTMCTDCHNPIKQGSFHHTFGTRNNNLKQLQEFFIDVSWDIATKTKISKYNHLQNEEVVYCG